MGTKAKKNISVIDDEINLFCSLAAESGYGGHSGARNNGLNERIVRHNNKIYLGYLFHVHLYNTVHIIDSFYCKNYPGSTLEYITYRSL